MKTSLSQAALASAMFAAKGEFPHIAKNKKGQSGNRAFNYAPLDAILDACDPVLRRHGLMLTQGTEGHELITRLEHPASGEWRETRMPVNVEHANMQSYGIEVTYRRRYSVQLILGIVTEEDIDIKERQKRTGKDFAEDAQRPPPNPGIHAPARLAFESLQPEQQDRMRKLSQVVLKASGPSQMIDVIDAADLDQDEKAGLWSLLDSKTRSAIKQAQKEAA